MKGIIPLGLAALAFAAGILILLTPEIELGHVIGALLLGFGLALGAFAAARMARGRAAVMIIATYAGAVLGALVSRLTLGYRPMGLADAIPWILVMIGAGPVLAAAETPLLVAGGALLGLCLSVLYEQRRISPRGN